MTMLLAAAFQLVSLSFAAGAPMPQWTAHGAVRCPGSNRSPELRWRNAPAGARSFALVVYDPDARNGWYHWVAYDLPSSLRGLPAGAALPPRELGITSFGERRYGGPCPPPGPVHHYIFTLYALDVRTIDAGAPLDAPALLVRMRGHILASARLVGLYRL